MMSKLAHSNEKTMLILERKRVRREGFPKCNRCKGAGSIVRGGTTFYGMWLEICHVCDGDGFIVE